MSERQLDTNDLIGAVCLRSQWRFFARFVQYWFLYYPGYDRLVSTGSTFRNGLFRVDETNADEFLKVMEPYEIFPEDIKRVVSQELNEGYPLMFVVNFDAKLFINGYYDQDLENNAPKGWESRWDEPMNYVPEAIQSLWKA